jgi:hypothetical protein
MPELERSQAEHPDHWLYTSESWDPRVPESSAIDPAFDPARRSMLRDILACHPDMTVFATVYGPPVQMPPSFYVTESDKGAATVTCVRKALPRGYIVEPVTTQAGQANI